MFFCLNLLHNGTSQLQKKKNSGFEEKPKNWCATVEGSELPYLNATEILLVFIYLLC
jgi:hypothetical protein